MIMNNVDFETYFKHYPDENGYFGRYGGVFVSEELKKAMAEITEAYYTIAQSRKFIAELRRIRKEFQGRPTPISHLEAGGCAVRASPGRLGSLAEPQRRGTSP